MGGYWLTVHLWTSLGKNISEGQEERVRNYDRLRVRNIEGVLRTYTRRSDIVGMGLFI